MLAVAELGESFSEGNGEGLLIEVEDDLLCVPDYSDQGVHALQGMLANSIMYENATRYQHSDLNQALRATERPSLRMADLFCSIESSEDTKSDIPKNSMDTYRPTPFLDQGMLSFYMHAEDKAQNRSSLPMTDLIQEEELSLVPSVSTLH